MSIASGELCPSWGEGFDVCEPVPAFNGRHSGKSGVCGVLSAFFFFWCCALLEGELFVGGELGSSKKSKMPQDAYPVITSILKSLRDFERIYPLYSLPSGSWEGYSVGEHTSMTLGQLHKHSISIEDTFQLIASAEELKKVLTRVLVFHDLGKFLPEKDSCRPTDEEMHHRSLEYFCRYAEELDLSSKHVKLGELLIGSDIIGSFFKRLYPSKIEKEQKYALWEGLIAKRLSFDSYLQTIDSWEESKVSSKCSADAGDQLLLEAHNSLISGATALEIRPKEYLFYQTVFFQADSSAYTWEATYEDKHAIPSLDYVYDRRPAWLSELQTAFYGAPSTGLLAFSRSHLGPYLRLTQTL